MPNRFHLTPTHAARAANCMHAWFLDCHGDPGEKVAFDDVAKRLIGAGVEHEREVFKSLGDAVEVAWDGKDWAAGHAATCALMREGVRWIYQPILVRDDVRGRPDFLRRVRGRSLVGRHAYEPIDVKNHKAVSSRDRVQLRISAHLLEPVLGTFPRRGAIWTSGGKIVNVKLEEPGDLLDEMRRVRDERVTPDAVRCGECGRCPWNEHCGREWTSSKHVTLVYGLTGRRALRVLGAGLRNYEDLARMTPSRLAQRIGIASDAAIRLVRGARAHARGVAVSLARATWPDAPAAHFYDIETQGEHVYLHGLVTLESSGRTLERQALSVAVTDERRAWHEFLDVVAGLPEGPIFSWTDYERGFVRALWKRHRGNARGYRRLNRDLTDLCAFVREHYALPTSSYSLKEVAPVFGFAWQAEDAGGLAASAWYEQWLADGGDALLHKIREYNLDDVRAMVVVYRALRGPTGIGFGDRRARRRRRGAAAPPISDEFGTSPVADV